METQTKLTFWPIQELGLCLFILQREVWFCNTYLDLVSIGFIDDSFVIILTPKYFFHSMILYRMVICDILYIVFYNKVIFVTVKR